MSLSASVSSSVKRGRWMRGPRLELPRDPRLPGPCPGAPSGLSGPAGASCGAHRRPASLCPTGLGRQTPGRQHPAPPALFCGFPVTTQATLGAEVFSRAHWVEQVCGSPGGGRAGVRWRRGSTLSWKTAGRGPSLGGNISPWGALTPLTRP